MTKFKVGDRVRMSESYKVAHPDDENRDTPAEIVDIHTGKFANLEIRYDGIGITGLAYEHELELIDPEQDLQAEIDNLTEHYEAVIAHKNAALRLAAFAFDFYKEQHLAKETPESSMKAITNTGLAAMMLNALEAD